MEEFSKFPQEKELLTFPGEQFEVVELGEAAKPNGEIITAYYCKYIGNIYNGNFDIKVNPKIDKDFEEFIVPSMKQISENTVLCMRKDSQVHRFGYFNAEEPSLYKIKAFFNTGLDKVFLITLPPLEKMYRSLYTVNSGGVLSRREVKISLDDFLTSLVLEEIVEWSLKGTSQEIPKPQIVWKKDS